MWVVGAVALSLLHAVLPTHWLPFVLVARAQGWNRRRLAALVVVAGLGHLASTLALCLASAWAGHHVVTRMRDAEGMGGLLGSGLLLLVGAVYFSLGVRDREHARGHHHASHETPERETTLSLVAVPTLAPCAELAPVFLAAGGMGWTTLGLLALLVTLSSLAATVVLALATSHGMDHFHFHWLERNERLAIGLVLGLLGLGSALASWNSLAG
ncbi:MAG: hypothetical protein HY722_07300 [Planctomycetes bacterium]|nr:hypothetical protein [Planctomycetota bacterium]